MKKGLLLQRRFSKNLEERRGPSMGGRLAGREERRYKGPEAGFCLECWRNERRIV